MQEFSFISDFALSDSFWYVTIPFCFMSAVLVILMSAVLGDNLLK